MRSESEMIEAMKQALTALERQDVIGWSATINALRAAIAEATIKDNLTVEPVAYVAGYYNGQLIVNFMDTAVILPPGMALYRAPSEWVGLTDEEIEQLMKWPEKGTDLLAFARAIEAKLKEKNS
jgi:hypothetical protein